MASLNQFFQSNSSVNKPTCDKNTDTIFSIGFLDQFVVAIATPEVILSSNQTAAFFLSALTSNTSFSEVFLSLFLINTSNILVHKGKYKQHASNIKIELSTIYLESIITIYEKTFVKIADLAYFSQLKKHSKICDYRT